MKQKIDLLWNFNLQKRGKTEEKEGRGSARHKEKDLQENLSEKLGAKDENPSGIE